MHDEHKYGRQECVNRRNDHLGSHDGGEARVEITPALLELSRAVGVQIVGNSVFFSVQFKPGLKEGAHGNENADEHGYQLGGGAAGEFGDAAKISSFAFD